ncbi:hypothetical protein DAPPUDRAFT_247224 [Daphnia pulex]|uniref:Uncharacterized protein n=1 Tax=Daphnia pulex TaxID=6669 RepID=E9GS08_DAPPU|nr:hypothetical protein DAPPUDRAFT_247224 [Daphnia pulex]|eukprot:EFX77741.1 hypothetical protein DAPPUDRAFT_247224 [Daphnia pulex]
MDGAVGAHMDAWLYFPGIKILTTTEMMKRGGNEADLEGGGGWKKAPGGRWSLRGQEEELSGARPHKWRHQQSISMRPIIRAPMGGEKPVLPTPIHTLVEMRLVNGWRRIERRGSVAFELSAASLPPKRRCLFSLPGDEGREPPSIVRQQQQRSGRLDASIIFCRVLICMSMRAPPLLASPDDDATGEELEEEEERASSSIWTLLLARRDKDIVKRPPIVLFCGQDSVMGG